MPTDHINQSELEAILTDFEPEIRPEKRSVQLSKTDGGIPVISIKGRVWPSSATNVVDKMIQFLGTRPIDVVFDVTNCEYLSSIALAVIQKIGHDRASTDHRVYLVGARDPVLRASQLIGLDHVVSFCDTMEQAIALLANREDA